MTHTHSDVVLTLLLTLNFDVLIKDKQVLWFSVEVF